jgi:hypothetical protein
MARVSFPAVIGTWDASRLWPDSRLVRSLWTRGVPVDVEPGDAGLTFTTRTRLLRGARWAPVTLPWSEIAGAVSTPLGHIGRTGGLTLRASFRVVVQVVGSRLPSETLAADPASFLPGFPAGVNPASLGGSIPLTLTMARGTEFAATVEARAAAAPS